MNTYTNILNILILRHTYIHTQIDGDIYTHTYRG